MNDQHISKSVHTLLSVLGNTSSSYLESVEDSRSEVYKNTLLNNANSFELGQVFAVLDPQCILSFVPLTLIIVT